MSNNRFFSLKDQINQSLKKSLFLKKKLLISDSKNKLISDIAGTATSVSGINTICDIKIF